MALATFKKKFAAAGALAGLVMSGLVTSASMAPKASAAPAATGTATSVAYTAGKAQGSNKWGLIGDVETYDGTPTFTYGVEFNPVDGSMWVTDSGKVLYSNFGCSIAFNTTSPCQAGNPRVFRYMPNQVDPAAATGYAGNGTFTAPTAAVNDGFGAFYSPRASRQVIEDPVFGGPATQHGPRGVTFTADGTAWVVDAEAVAPVGGPAGALKRFDSAGTPLGASGWTGIWAERDKPGVHFYRTGAARTPENTVLVNSESSDRLQEYNADGSFKGSILLDNPAFAPGVPNPIPLINGNAVRNPYSVGVDLADGSRYISLMGFTEAPGNTVAPYIEKRDANNRVIQNVGQGRFGNGQVVFGPHVNNIPGTPTYRHMFAFSQNSSAVQEFDENGNFVRQWLTGTTAQANAQPGASTGAAPGGDLTVAVPGLNTPRHVAFDSRGYVYMTVAQGTASTKVLIMGMTPPPVQNVCSDRAADGTSVTLNWECDTSSPSTNIRDYSVEMSSDGGATWSLVPHDPSTEKTRTITGLDPAATYSFRVAAWNEAGNGDWASVTVPPSVQYTNDAGTLTFEDGTLVPGESVTMPIDVAANDTNSAGREVKLLDAKGAPANTVTVSGEGTYTVEGAGTVKFTPEKGFDGKSTVKYVLVDPASTAGVKPCPTGAVGVLTMTVLQRSTTPQLSVTKVGSFEKDGVHKAGDRVFYDFVVENNGKSDLKQVKLTDPKVSQVTFGQWPGAEGELKIGEKVTARGEYTLTQADIDAGTLNNTVEASGQNAKGVEAKSSAASTLSIKHSGGLSINKSGVLVGDKIAWTITLKNTGNVPLSSIVIKDGLAGLSPMKYTWPAGGTQGTLAPDAVLVAKATSPAEPRDKPYTVTNDVLAQAVMPDGQGTVATDKVLSSVVVGAKTPAPNPTPTPTSSPTVTPSPAPSGGPTSPAESTTEPTPAPEDPLASTGNSTGPLLWGGLALLGAGALALGLRLRRK